LDPVVTPEEMGAIDAEAPEPVDELIDRAGWATARAALRLLREIRSSGRWDGALIYGARVAVLAGKGNNGADGRSAARFLRRRGVTCEVFDVGGSAPADDSDRRPGSDYDLIIDACFGTGLRGDFWSDELPVDVGDTPVLAVDIPSGVNGMTGQTQGRPLPAMATVTFAALKPGLLFEPGRSLAGRVEVADIGLDCSRARLWHLGPADLARWPKRQPSAHKWGHAVAVVGGGPGMSGAATLTGRAALRAGAGYVINTRPGPMVGPDPAQPTEAVTVSLDDDWDRLSSQVGRCAAVVVGPGLDLDDRDTDNAVKRLLRESDAAVVLDAGAIRPDVIETVVGRRSAEKRLPVLTPHDGEFERLMSSKPGPDRLAAVRRVADSHRAVVVLKGPSTVVAQPDGRALISTAGDQRLATAGTGDVLAGIIGAGLSLGLDSFLAAGLGVELHGRAALRGRRVGLTAGDLPDLVAELLTSRSQ